MSVSEERMPWVCPAGHHGRRAERLLLELPLLFPSLPAPGRGPVCRSLLGLGSRLWVSHCWGVSGPCKLVPASKPLWPLGRTDEYRGPLGTAALQALVLQSGRPGQGLSILLTLSKVLVNQDVEAGHRPSEGRAFSTKSQKGLSSTNGAVMCSLLLRLKARKLWTPTGCCVGQVRCFTSHEGRQSSYKVTGALRYRVLGEHSRKSPSSQRGEGGAFHVVLESKEDCVVVSVENSMQRQHE